MTRSRILEVGYTSILNATTVGLLAVF